MEESNKQIVHQKGKQLQYVQFKKLLEYPEVVQGYTKKENGFDIGGNEAPVKIQSYGVLAEEFNIQPEQIIRPYQLHTDVVKSVKRENRKRQLEIFPKDLMGVDGLITNQRNIYLCLSYADCTPILLYDPTKHVIGNIHSGWKGTLKKIGQKAVIKMIEEYHCKPENILCFFGPTIHSCHFEVEQEVAELFYQEFKQDSYIQKGKRKEGKQKYTIDTIQINTKSMEQIGLKKENIMDSGLCTVCEEKAFHSYRVKGKQAGRNVAILGLR